MDIKSLLPYSTGDQGVNLTRNVQLVPRLRVTGCIPSSSVLHCIDRETLDLPLFHVTHSCSQRWSYVFKWSLFSLTAVAATLTIHRLLPTTEKKSLLCLPTPYSLNNLLCSLLPAACLGKKHVLNFLKFNINIWLSCCGIWKPNGPGLLTHYVSSENTDSIMEADPNKSKGKGIPLQTWTGPRGFQEA